MMMTIMSALSSELPADRRYFWQLFISVLVSVGNGSIFCFGIISPFMKEPAFSLNQTQVNIISTCGVVLSYFSLPTGFLFDRFGPKSTLLVGAALNMVGWLGMFVIFYDTENPLLGTSTVVMSFFFGLSQWSASFYETGSVLTNLEAMSLHRGRVVIIQKTFMGLGSSIITQLYIAFFQGRYAISTFFLFLCVFNSSLGVLGAYTIRLPTAGTRVLGLNWESTGSVEQDGEEEGHPQYDTAEGADEERGTASVRNKHGQRYGALCTPPNRSRPATPSTTNASAALLDATKARFEPAFRFGVALLLVVVAYIVGLTISEAYVTIEGDWRYVIGFVTVVLLLLFAVMVPLVPLRMMVPSDDSNLPSLPAAETSSAGRCSAGILIARCVGATTSGPSCALHHGASVPVADRPLALSSTNGDVTVADKGSSDAPEPLAAVEGSSTEAFSSLTDRDEVIPTHKLNDKPLSRNVRLLDMHLMWFVSFAVWGTGTVVSANSTQIYQALDFVGYSSALDSVYVSIYGVASAVGRIGVGFADNALRTRNLNVVRLFPVAPCINVIGIPLLFLLPPKGLIVAFFLSGLATGVTWGSTVLIIKSLFSHGNCGKHYNVLYTAGMLTPLLMNVALFGPLYDKESAAQQRQATRTCSGPSCIDIPLLLSLAFNVVAIPCAIVFARRVIRNGGLS